jgi:ribosomal protein S12 methylthiotransferase
MTDSLTSPPQPAPTTVALVTLGCARNEVDSEELAARLERDGLRLVEDPAQAAAVVVNTCGFVEAAKKDSVDTLLAAADLKPEGRVQAVVAVGCLAERYGNELAESLPEADAVLGFDDYADIGARVRSVLAGTPHVPHTPRDRRRLLPIAPADRSVAATQVPDLPEGPAAGQRAPPAAPPARRRPRRAAEAGVRLRPPVHVLRDPALPRLLRLPPAHRAGRRGPVAGRPRRP